MNYEVFLNGELVQPSAGFTNIRDLANFLEDYRKPWPLKWVVYDNVYTLGSIPNIYFPFSNPYANYPDLEITLEMKYPSGWVKLSKIKTDDELFAFSNIIIQIFSHVVLSVPDQIPLTRLTYTFARHS